MISKQCLNSIKWELYNLLYIIKHLQLKYCRETKPIVYMVLDKGRKYSGLLDIIKSIVGIYYIAKVNKFDFRLKFIYPFELNKYLIPHKINWNDNGICNSIINVKMLNYKGIGKIPKLISSKQYHVVNFQGWNILQRNNINNWEFEWQRLYNELFKPSDYLQNQINSLPYTENSYIAVHLRFVNSLEILEPDLIKYYSQLNEEKKSILLKNCFSTLERISKRENKKILIFSDSNSFLKLAQNKGYLVLSGQVRHIRYNNNDDTVMKTFLDLYAIGRAQRVYSITGDSLYQSVFPFYGALISGKTFIRINYNDNILK